MALLVKNAHIIDPNSKWNGQTLSILIESGKITSIGNDVKASEAVVFDAEGAYISPGWFDMQAHFNDPGYEHKEDLQSGCQAAASGGFTGVLLLPNTKPVVQNKNAVSYITRDNDRRLVQLYATAAVTPDTQGEDLTEMYDLHTAGAAAFSDGLNPIWHTDILLKALQYLQPFNGLLINRPDDKMLSRFGQMHEGLNNTLLGMKGIPALAEELMIARDLELLRYAGGKIHFSNLSCAASVARIRKAKAEGLNVSCDVAAHQLYFTDEALMSYDTRYKVNPPLRGEIDRKALIEGLLDGTIDTIVSSHQPQDTESKFLEFDLAEFGMPAVQTVWQTLNSLDALKPELVVEKLALNPRKILGITTPVIIEGQEANLSMFSTQGEFVLNEQNNRSKSPYSPLMGQTLKGKVLGVIRGEHHEFFA